jgi:EAL domain-containing protein (putative c-di-GMP-specific phosphodiesterase class I)
VVASGKYKKEQGFMALGQNNASQEYLLLDYAQRLERHRQDRRAVHIHLSRLKPQNRREHHIRIAANTFEDLVKQYEGQIFMLSNADLIFVCRGATIEDIDEAIIKLRYLFSEDPLSADGGEDDKFATWYDIEAHYPRFLALAERLYEAEQDRAKRQSLQSAQEEAAKMEARRPLNPEQLGKLEAFLRQADLSNVMRRQSVCVVKSGEKPKPIFKELYVAIGELAETVLPEVDLIVNRWLFQHLTQTFDRRVLKMLARGDDSDLHASFSINLNVQTLLSPEFLEFDSSLRMGSRGTIVVELQLVDIFADLAGFVFARDFVREKGYRICLDGITAGTLPFIDRRRLGVDLVKVIWGQDMVAGGGEDDEPTSDVTEAIKSIGTSRVIMARCDSPSSIRLGQNLGISMFQGRHIDTILYAESRRGQSATARRGMRR